MSKGKIKVLIVDDSALVRKLLTDILSADAELEVVGTAMDAHAAREKIKALHPDVITLDIEMPKMDGITFLRNLMRLNPLPVIMISTLTEKGAEVTLDALQAGAVDFVSKPKIDISNTLDEYSEEITTKVKAAANVRVRRLETGKTAAAGKDARRAKVASGSARHFSTTDKIIAIGASTGGTEAIREVLEEMPLSAPGIVIAQHIPEYFSKAFADRVNLSCAITVAEAKDGDIVLPGHAYIAPGNQHLSIRKDGARWRCRLLDSEPVNRHRPSVDVLFNSVAECAGQNALGVILTGMGKDGARGLLALRSAGAHTIAQDEASSVVWGMPGSAVELGAAAEVLPLDRIGSTLLSALAEKAG
ncbi:MAG: chemotaxis response regulator protein-glutamate methylesterase [Pseudomonadales bacterium]|nr:chemotaxis response regulator protein-glutamate methylesterase [Pseudomonadales bacterium]